jgi:hypothetical protein
MSFNDWVDKDGVGLMYGTVPFKSINVKKSHYENHDYIVQIGLFLDAFGTPKFNFFYNNHQVSLMSKQAFVDAKQAYPKLYEKTTNLKGRETTEYITRNLIEYINIDKGYIKLTKRPMRHDYLDSETDFKNYELDKDTVLFCAGLHSKLFKDRYEDFVRFMIELFPKPLPSEKSLKYEHLCFYNYTRKKDQLCKSKPVVQTDDPCLLPFKDDFDILHRIPGLRKTRRRRRFERCT